MSQSPWQKASEDSRQIHSFLFSDIWLAMWRGRLARKWLFVIVLPTILCLPVLLLFIMAAVNQTGPLIDHVGDPRPWHDYTRTAINRMAGSEDWLALATSNGLTLLNKDSRVPHEVVIPEGVRDVVGGPGVNDFLMLKDNQEIAIVSPQGSRLWGGVHFETWLPSPDKMYWGGKWPEQPEIIANEMDSKGWLIAVKGLGVARYLVGSDSNGEQSRLRSWQLTPASQVSLRDAVITTRGVWVTLQEGGIRYLDRETLEEAARFSLTNGSAPIIVQLQADREGHWASAQDEQGGIWFFLEDEAGWQGPFLSYERNGDCQLGELEDITVARWQDPFVWLGSNQGLLVYDTNRRNLNCAVPDVRVSNIELVGGSPSQTILVASNEGLFLVSAAQGGGKLEYTLLDKDEVLSLSLSADASLATYQVRVPASETNEARAIHAPFDTNSYVTLAHANAWFRIPTQPQVVGIQDTEAGLLFATSSGAFLYDPERAVYQNSYEGVFTFLDQVQDKILGIARDSPLIYIPDSNDWNELDPSHMTRPRSLTSDTGRVFGVSGGGEIYQYDPAGGEKPAIFLSGEANSLNQFQPESNRIIGDILLRSDTNPIIALVNNAQLVIYDSETGSIGEKPLPILPDESLSLRQVRLLSEETLYLLDNGAVIAGTNAPLFGTNGFPFAPDRMTAIAPSHQANTVLVAGSTGHVLHYDWSTGSVEVIGGEAITSDGLPLPIIRVQETTQSILAMARDGTVFAASRDTSWNKQPYQQWAVDQSGEHIFTLQGSDVFSNLDRFSHGTGMRDFVQNARFVWQPDPKRLVFFGSNNFIGVYNSATDNWEEHYVGYNLKQYRAGGDFLIILDKQNRLLKVTADLSFSEVASLPTNASNVTLQLGSDNSLTVAYLDNSTVYLRRWGDVNMPASFTESRRGTLPNLIGFEPSDVIYARRSPTGIHLMDIHGNFVRYDNLLNNWELLRSAAEGDSVLAWFTVVEGGTPVTVFVLGEDQQGKSAILPIRGDHIPQEEIVPQSLEELLQGKVLASWLCSPSRRQLAEMGPCPENITFGNQYLYFGLHTRQIHFPNDGTLFQGEGLKIVRNYGKTAFLVTPYTNQDPPTSVTYSSALDSIHSVALSNSGQLWAVLQDRRTLMRLGTLDDSLVPLATETRTEIIEGLDSTVGGEYLVFVSASGSHTLVNENELGRLEKVDGAQAHPVATIDVANHQIIWSLSPYGEISGAWDQSADSIWDTVGDKLAIQHINDLALTIDGKLLLSTQGGLLVRDSSTFEPVGFFPELYGAHFISTWGPSRVFIVREGHALMEWVRGMLIELKDSSIPDSTVDLGPWQWQMNNSVGEASTIRIVRAHDTQPRQWIKVANSPAEWKFKDDIIRWIARSQTENVVVLATEDGSWLFDWKVGHRVMAVSSGLLEEPLGFSNEIVSIPFVDGHLVLPTADEIGGDLFSSGRFFFDNGEQMVGLENGLFVLVSGRGVVRRDPNAPGHITGFWNLPEKFPDDTRYQLVLSVDGIDLQVWLPERTTGRAWLLVLGDGLNGRWQEHEINEHVWLANADLITWYKDQTLAGDIRIEPYYEAPPLESMGISNWWYQDRFVWDVAECIGTLDGNTVAILTPIGAIIKESSDGAYRTIDFDPISGMDTCNTARSTGTPVGMAVGTTDAPLQRLVSLSKGYNVGDVGIAKPVVVLGYTVAANGQEIDFSEQWVPKSQPTNALFSSLYAESANDLVHNGRFFFDLVTGAAYMGGMNWLTYDSKCKNEQRSECYLVFNRLSGIGDSRSSRLVLRDVSRIGIALQTIRSSGDSLVGLHKDEKSEWKALTSRLELTGYAKWRPTSLTETGELFRLGDHVGIDVATLSWRWQPAFVWETSALLTVEPADYRLFYLTSEGIALAFDYISSIAFDRSSPSHRLAIGTAGGAFVMDWNDNQRALLGYPEGSASFVCKPVFGASACVLDVRRLFFESNGNLWIGYGENQHMAKLSADFSVVSRQDDWPDELRTLGDVWINLNGDGLKIYDKYFERSNDAFGFDQQRMIEIVSFVSSKDGKEIWIATRDSGIFRVLPR